MVLLYKRKPKIYVMVKTTGEKKTSFRYLQTVQKFVQFIGYQITLSDPFMNLDNCHISLCKIF